MKGKKCVMIYSPKGVNLSGNHQLIPPVDHYFFVRFYHSPISFINCWLINTAHVVLRVLSILELLSGQGSCTKRLGCGGPVTSRVMIFWFGDGDKVEGKE